MTRDEDALDRHLDELLAGTSSAAPDAVDPELARTARVVSLALARFHPSFRFEERLAARLRDSAAGEVPALGSASSPGPAVIIPFATSRGPQRGRSRRVNGALIGGAISAGVSLASLAGALVARRRGRGDGRWERWT